MKSKILTILICIFSTIKAYSQSFEAEGFIKEIENGEICLVSIVSKDTITKAYIKNNQVLLKGSYPSSAPFDVTAVSYIASDKKSTHSGLFFIEKNKKINFRFEFQKSPKFGGTAYMNEINQCIQALSANFDLIEKLKAKEQMNLDSLNRVKQIVSQDVYNFVKANENSQLLEAGLVILFQVLSVDMMNGDELTYHKKVAESISTKSQLAQLGLMMMKSKSEIMIGKKASNFSLKQTTNKLFVLDSLLGKDVLIVFWASWCAPCIKNIDNLKQIYQEIGKTNFEIVSISIDENENAHKNAVEKNQINWISLLDLPKNNPQAISKQYLASTIPYYILIDKKGFIVQISSQLKSIEESIKQIK